MNKAPDDRDIDCPLFNVLQRWVVEQFGVAPKDAKEYARNFMRNYWLVGDSAPPPGAVFRDNWGDKP